MSVTAVIPHWGDPAPLERALASVADQIEPVVEAIVVDDASPAEFRDGIARVVETHAAQGLSIRLITQPRNAGPGEARNAGWDAAGGEYVAFLDNDDAWHPEKTKRQIAVMRETDALFSGHAYCANRSMKRIVDGYRTYDFRDFLLRNRVSTPTVMVRREVDIRFPQGQRRSEDYAVWLRLARRQPLVFLHAELARGFKNPWGEAGLSADLKAMTAGQHQTYRGLREDGLIGGPLCEALLLWSRIRHMRRVLKLSVSRGR